MVQWGGQIDDDDEEHDETEIESFVVAVWW